MLFFFQIDLWYKDPFNYIMKQLNRAMCNIAKY